MAFTDKLKFWKKEPVFDDNQGGYGAGNLGMDTGMGAPPGIPPPGMGQQGLPPGMGQGGTADLSGFDDFENPNQSMGPMDASRGLPDVTAFKGVGDPASQRAMNQSLYQQGQMDYSVPSNPPFGSSSRNAPVELPSGDNRQLEIIAAKLDAIKATVESVNQRLANLERLANIDDRQSRNW